MEEALDCSTAALPSVVSLYARYRRFASEYFDGRVPPAEDVRIEWSTRMTSSAGLCRPRSRTIRLSVHYHTKFPEEVNATLLHEMIHLLVPNHGPAFYAWMDTIRRRGGRVSRYAKERATPRQYRWVYVCRHCGMRKKTMRRYPHGGRQYRCGRCGGKLAENRLSVGGTA